MKNSILLISILSVIFSFMLWSYSKAANSLITFCYNNNGIVRILIDKKDHCPSNAKILTLNTEGMPGPQGPEGPQGPKGEDGISGIPLAQITNLRTVHTDGSGEVMILWDTDIASTNEVYYSQISPVEIKQENKAADGDPLYQQEGHKAFAMPRVTGQIYYFVVYAKDVLGRPVISEEGTFQF